MWTGQETQSYWAGWEGKDVGMPDTKMLKEGHSAAQKYDSEASKYCVWDQSWLDQGPAASQGCQ